MGPSFSHSFSQGPNSKTYAYSRCNGYGASESRTTTVDYRKGTCQSAITRADGSGRVYSNVITGPGCDNTNDYYRGGPRHGMWAQNVPTMYCSCGSSPQYSCSSGYYTVVPSPIVLPSDQAATSVATPPPVPANNQQMMAPAPASAPMAMAMAPVYTYNTGVPILPAGTACGYAQGYGFYSGLNARYGYGNTYNTPYYGSYPAPFSGYPNAGRGW